MTSNESTSDFESISTNNEYFIKIEGPEHCKQSGNFKISGQFNVSYEKNGVTVQGAKVLKHIVLVVTRSGNYHSLTPFKDVVVFDDDVKDEGDSCSGFFNINVADHIAFDGEGDYYILCSLGTYLSNTLKITI